MILMDLLGPDLFSTFFLVLCPIYSWAYVSWQAHWHKDNTTICSSPTDSSTKLSHRLMYASWVETEENATIKNKDALKLASRQLTCAGLAFISPNMVYIIIMLRLYYIHIAPVVCTLPFTVSLCLWTRLIDHSSLIFSFTKVF